MGRLERIEKTISLPFQKKKLTCTESTLGLRARARHAASSKKKTRNKRSVLTSILSHASALRKVSDGVAPVAFFLPPLAIDFACITTCSEAAVECKRDAPALIVAVDVRGDERLLPSPASSAVRRPNCEPSLGLARGGEPSTCPALKPTTSPPHQHRCGNWRETSQLSPRRRRRRFPHRRQPQPRSPRFPNPSHPPQNSPSR